MSSRRRAPKRKPVSVSVRAGLEDLAAGNVAAIASMLDKELADEAAVADALEEVMGVNSISAEQLLASYFEADMLSAKLRQMDANIADATVNPTFVT